MRRLDDRADQEELYLKVAVYGKPGTGKTSFGTSAPNPLILLSERQGMLHVRQAAQRLGVAVPPVLFCEHLSDYRDVLRAFWGDRTKPFQVWHVWEEGGEKKRRLGFELPTWPETIVLDQLTDVCRLVTDEIREQSPPKIGADGLPVDSQRYWNVFEDRAKRLILSYRDAPAHVVFLCQVDDREVGEEGDRRRSVTPDLSMRRLPGILCGSVNVVGYSYRRERRTAQDRQAELVYGIMTVGPEYMMLKPLRPLRDTEIPNFSYWVKRVNGSLSQEVPAPVGSGESLAGALSESDKPIVPGGAGAPAGQPAPAVAAPDPPAPVAPPDEPAVAKGKRRRGAA